jgi:hypothetical protein
VAAQSPTEETPMPHITNTEPPSRSRGKSRKLLAGIIAAATLSWPALAGNEAIPNFMPDARTGWIAGVREGEFPIGDEFLPPLSGPGPITYDRAHPFIDNAASRRSELRKLNERALTEVQLWTPKERCWPIGVPGWLLYPVRPVRFLQLPNKVLLIWEEDHMVRHIYLTDKHSPDVKPSWFGESIGHYENGDTLVVDTVGLNTRTRVDSYQTPHTEQLHVVERYRLVDNGEAIDAVAYVEDPGAFTTPWTARQRYRRNTDAPLAEEICAENNGDHFNQSIMPMPTADKPDF